MKPLSIIVPWFLVGMLLVLFLSTQYLLERAHQRELEWHAMVNRSIAATDSCTANFTSLYQSFQEVSKMAEERYVVPK